MLTRKDFMGSHEWCFYGWKEGAGHKFFGPEQRAPTSGTSRRSTRNKMVHLTEKPVELAVRAMQYSSRAGENVLDLFGGSGSTLIAAEQTGRKAFLMELDAPYAMSSFERWENFTGKKAERASRPSRLSPLRRPTHDLPRLTVHARRSGRSAAAIRGGLSRGGRANEPRADGILSHLRTVTRSAATACRWTGDFGRGMIADFWRSATRSSC